MAQQLARKPNAIPVVEEDEDKEKEQAEEAKKPEHRKAAAKKQPPNFEKSLGQAIMRILASGAKAKTPTPTINMKQDIPQY